MTNSLPPDLAAFVQASVASGAFESPEAVVVAGIRALQARQQYEDRVLAQLQQGDDDFDRGDYVELTTEQQRQEFLRERLRLAQERIATRPSHS